MVALDAIANRSALDIDGIAGVISHESGFRPNAKNPVGTATGLIQFIESTARSLGTTTAALAKMSAVQQLPYVERYFVNTLGSRRPPAEDYILATYGRVDAIGNRTPTFWIREIRRIPTKRKGIEKTAPWTLAARDTSRPAISAPR